MDEARPEGGFGKESFLRAIVVQLSQAIETNHGPAAAEAAIAQVGTDVGWQIEEEFRLAEEVVGRMTPEQLGRCFVRLKHAIDGGFSVVEASAASGSSWRTPAAPSATPCCAPRRCAG